MKGVDIRPLVESDVPALERLAATREGLDPNEAGPWAERMAWLAFENPHADGGPPYYVAERRGEIIGHLGRMPTRLVVGGELLDACYVHDLYVDPVCRGEGLSFFLAMGLYKAVEEAAPGPLIGLWTNPVNVQLKQLRRFEILEHGQLLKILDPSRYVARVVRWAPLRPLGVLGARIVLSTLDVLPRGRGRRDVRLEDTERFGSDHDALAGELLDRGGIRTHSEAAVLNWKYVDLPGIDFVRRTAYSDDRAVGYSVLRLYPDGGARLVDLQCDPVDARLVATLVRAAVKDARAAGAEALTCAATDPRLVEVLKRRGFLAAPDPVHVALLFRDRAPDAGLDELSRWHIVFGESDFALIA